MQKRNKFVYIFLFVISIGCLYTVWDFSTEKSAGDFHRFVLKCEFEKFIHTLFSDKYSMSR